MASAELSRRVEKVVGYPPLCELSDLQRREFHEALLEAASFRGSGWSTEAGRTEEREGRPEDAPLAALTLFRGQSPGAD